MPEDTDSHQHPTDLSFCAEAIKDKFEIKIVAVQEKLDILVAQAPFGIITTTEDGICKSINQTLLSRLSLSIIEVINNIAFQKWVTPESWILIQNEFAKSRSAAFNPIRIDLVSKNTNIHPVTLSCNPYFDTYSNTYMRRWILIDGISYPKYPGLCYIDSLLLKSELAICLLDLNGNILICNNAMTNLTGYDRDQLQSYITDTIFKNDSYRQLFHKIKDSIIDIGHWEGQIRGIRHDQTMFVGWLNVTRLADSYDAIRFVLCLYDITRNTIDQEINSSLAKVDSLTNLPNRRAYYERFSREQSVSTRSKLFGAVLYIDLDNFKFINDTKGHACGDKLLVEAANRLERSVRTDDLVVRMGGDEFVIILADLNSDLTRAAFQARKTGEVLLKSLERPWNVNESDFICTASIGVAMFGPDESPDELLKHADLAMYNAKKRGRNRVQFYDEAMQTATLDEVIMDQDLRRAVIFDQFDLFYQPQTNINHEIISAEALIRWRHPTQGLLVAEDFISLTEENGLIVPIGQWVMNCACNKLKEWQSNPLTRRLRLAVNISGRQFAENNFDKYVIDVINKTQINPSLLILELTESVVHNLDLTLNKMRNIQSLGVEFSLDDFGTGYSSLAVLIELPISQLKIDKSFIKSITVNKSAAVVTETIIAMARTLEIEVLAEGVETLQQLNILKTLGCTHYQGNYFGAATDASLFEKLLFKTNSEHT